MKLNYLPPWLDREVQLSRYPKNVTPSRKLRNGPNTSDKEISQPTLYIKKQYVSNLVSQPDNKQTNQLWNVLRNIQKLLTIPDISQSSTDPCNTPPLDVANSLNQHFVNLAKSQNSSYHIILIEC